LKKEREAASDVDLRCTAEPSLPCLGDSGGPVLARSGVIGVVSSGDPGCSDHARAMRVDAYASTFIAPELAAWDASSLAVGGCAVQRKQSEDRCGALLAVVGCIALARRGRKRLTSRKR
jgi:hypothetical protein